MDLLRLRPRASSKIVHLGQPALQSPFLSLFLRRGVKRTRTTARLSEEESTGLCFQDALLCRTHGSSLGPTALLSIMEMITRSTPGIRSRLILAMLSTVLSTLESAMP